MTMAVEFSAEIFGCFLCSCFSLKRKTLVCRVDTHTMYTSLLSLQQLSYLSHPSLFRAQRRTKLRDLKKKKERLRDQEEDDWDVYVFNKEKRGQAQEDVMLIETLSAFHQLPPGTLLLSSLQPSPSPIQPRIPLIFAHRTTTTTVGEKKKRTPQAPKPGEHSYFFFPSSRSRD